MQPLKRIYHSFFWSFLVVLCGFVLSAFVSWKSAEWIEQTEKERFQTATQQIVFLIRNVLKDNVQLLHSAAAFIASSKEVTREEWAYFINQHHIENLFVGLQGLAYVPRIQPSQYAQYEQHMRDNEGFSAYKIFPQPTGLDAYPIMYIEPFNEHNLNALGFNMVSERRRKSAIDEAIYKGEVAFSSKIELMQEKMPDEKQGFIIFFPVYDKNMPHNTPEERFKAVRGFVSAGMKVKSLFQGVLGAKYIKLDFEIYDGTTSIEAQKLYDSNPSLKLPRLERYQILDFYGKNWTLYFKANEVLDVGSSRYLPWIELVFGMGLSLIFGGWIYTLQRTRQEAYRVAAEKSEQLYQSETAIRAIFQAMQEGVIIMDSKGCIAECNASAQEMLQVKKNDIIGNYQSDPKWKAVREDGTLFALDEHPSFMALRTGKVQSNVIMGVKRSDGTLLWLNVNAQPVFADNLTTIDSILVTLNDITAYRKSKYELEKYLQIIDTYVIISSTDIHGIIIETSDAFCKISGYTKEELIGQSHSIVRHPDMPKSLYQEIWGCLKKGISWSGEIQNRRKDGSDYWAESIITPRYNEAYDLVGYMAIRHDITDKKRVEELSITDHLTKLYNRLKLDKLFAYHLSVTKRYQTPFSIILLDLDKFKLVNDTYGHQVGDSLLQEIAMLLKNNVRLEDAVGRWGGEEFLILLPNGDIEAARLLAEKLCMLIQREKFTHVGNKTASFGVVTYHENDDEASMVARADAALYIAKESGRNRVEVEIHSCELSPHLAPS